MADRRAALTELEVATTQPPDAGVQLEERPHVPKLNLRGDAGEATFADAVAGVLGFGLPTTPNTTAGAGDAVALWLGPDEWLLVGDAGLGPRLAAALAGRHFAATDVTEGRTIIRLRGPRARDLLAKGCALDLHPAAFPAGAVAQSLLAQADIVLHRVADEGEAAVFDLYVARSVAPYLWNWLVDAAMEFGLRPGA